MAGDLRGAPKSLRLLLTVGGGRFPDLAAPLAHFARAFDRALARADGTLVPQPGVYAAYDEALATVAAMEKALDKELRRAQVELGHAKIAFYHPNNSKEQYQLQVPAALQSKIPRAWTLKSQTKAVLRYWTPEIERVQKPLAEAAETKNQVRRRAWPRLAG